MGCFWERLEVETLIGAGFCYWWKLFEMSNPPWPESRVITEGWSQKIIPPWPAPATIRPPPQLKLPRFYITRLMLEGVRMLALADAHNEIVSRSSATEGTLLELLMPPPLLLKDLQFLFLFPPYSSATSESATCNYGICDRSWCLKELGLASFHFLESRSILPFLFRPPSIIC